MRLILNESDVLEKFKGEKELQFHMLKRNAQAALIFVGKAIVHRGDGSNQTIKPPTRKK